jgi:hypothetical protein
MIGSSPRLTSPLTADRRLLVSYDNYPAAQRAVDTLSDAGYPVQNVAIVGSDLRLEELVTGRLTNPRAALSGAISGAVFGLIVGMFLGLFTSTTASFFALAAWAVLWGALMGAGFGFASHAFKGGTRDFTSRSAIVAGRYDVLVPSAALEQALAVLEGGTQPADTVVVDRPPSGGPLPTPTGGPDATTAPAGRPDATPAPLAGPGVTPAPSTPGGPKPAATRAEAMEEATVAVPMSSVRPATERPDTVTPEAAAADSTTSDDTAEPPATPSGTRPGVASEPAKADSTTRPLAEPDVTAGKADSTGPASTGDSQDVPPKP